MKVEDEQGEDEGKRKGAKEGGRGRGGVSSMVMLHLLPLVVTPSTTREAQEEEEDAP